MSEEKKSNGLSRFKRRLIQPQEDQFNEELKVNGEGNIGPVRADIRNFALKLLGLVEEFYSSGEADGTEENLALADEEDLEALLKKLEKPSDNKSDPREVIRRQIQEVLAEPGVKTEFFKVLKSESKKFQKARPTLKKVAKMEKLQEMIPRKITQMYLKDKRENGKLKETTKKTIAALEARKGDAKTEVSGEWAKADPDTKSWLHVQELLAYKKQLKEKGFAMTPNRKALAERILTGVSHGEKIFLVGSTGTGKTQLAALVADLVNNEGYEIVSWHEGTTPRDLFGYREVEQDEKGIKSKTKKGPVALAITDGKIIIHDEYTAGSTRAQLAAKAQLNAKAGQKLHLPGFNGEVFNVEEGFGEIFTGNLKDDRTKNREDMDPAILRMLSGVKVGYMPPEELFKVILASMIDETGYLPVGNQDVEMIRALTKASEMMQSCHDREIGAMDSATQSTITTIFGGNMSEVHMDKNFLDTGTLLRMFEGWDLEKAKGVQFSEFLRKKLHSFLHDPKFDMDKQEKELASVILNLSGVMKSRPANAEEMILPSQIGRIFKGKKKSSETEADDVDNKDTSPDTTPEGSDLTPEDLKWLNELVNKDYDEATQTCDLVLDSGKVEFPPTKESIRRSILSTLKHEQVAELKKLREPTLLLIPDTTADRLVSAINKPECKHIAGQKDAYVNDWYKDSLNKTSAHFGVSTPQAKITKYRFAICEGKQHFNAALTDSDAAWNKKANMKNQARIDAFEAHFKNKKIVSMNSPAYMMLMMKYLKAGKTLDFENNSNNFTLLSGEPKSAHVKGGAVAYGFWNRNSTRASFSRDFLNVENVSARLRASVMGEVLET